MLMRFGFGPYPWSTISVSLIWPLQTLGPLEGKGADKAAKAAKKGVRTFGENGECMFIKAAMLREMLVRMHKSGRYFVVGKAEEDKGLDEGPIDNIEEQWIVLVVYIPMEDLRVKVSPSDHAAARATKDIFKVLVALQMPCVGERQSQYSTHDSNANDPRDS
jgi:hypothetical protein